MKKIKFIILYSSIFFLGLNFASMQVSAQARVNQITLDATTKNIYTGQTIQLKTSVLGNGKKGEVKWVSSNKKIAIVTSKGKVTGKRKGLVKITAFLKRNGKIKAACMVKVKNLDDLQMKYRIKEFKNIPLRVDQSKVKTVKNHANLQKYIEKLKERKSAADHSYIKKLESYRKPFFKKNILCLFSVQAVSGSQQVEVTSLQVNKNKKDTLSGTFKVYLEKQDPGKIWTTDICVHHYIAEVEKRKGLTVDSYGIDIL